MKYFTIGLLIFITGCTTFSTCPKIGGIPNPIVLEEIKSDGTNSVINYKKSLDHYKASEKVFERIR